MNPQSFIALFLLFIMIPALLTGQSDLSADLPFFQRKAETFGRWLQQRGLSDYLSVNGTRLSEDGRTVVLDLELNSYELSHASALWEAMQASYRPSPGRATFEEGLFATFRRYFEVPTTKGRIQVGLRADPESGYRNPCFLLDISGGTDGRIRTSNRIQNCKSVILKVDLDLPPIYLGPVGSSKLHSRGSTEWVFRNIVDFARRKYVRSKPNCEQRFPEIIPVASKGDYLEFYVNDLCQTVLTNEKQSLWCDLVEFLGGSCNDTRRERLEFRIQLNRPDDATVQLDIELTGKFGSGVYLPRRSGWIDMDPDFEDDFLVPHARVFEQELITYLTRP